MKLSVVRQSPKITDGSHANDGELSADVCVIGTGAGGAVTAATLAAAGKDVLLVEEGGYWTSADFTQREADVMPKLYQEGGLRTTADVGIALLQGRAVGGTTVVNWTTSFRTPEDVVDHWKAKHQVQGFQYSDLIPHYDWIEKRLSIAKVSPDTMNPNNRKLYDGCKAMGWDVDTLRRNVHKCMQSGSCGLGCPVNAKRSMLVTMIPDAIEAGGRLVYFARIDRLNVEGSRITSAKATLLDETGWKPTGKTLTIRAKTFIVSCGAINGPALLLRSGIEDEGRVGARTFIHPVILSAGIYDDEILANRGAPQTAASHHFAHRGDEVGFFLETIPWYPMLYATGTPGFGSVHAANARREPHTALHTAISIDGFHDDVVGGRVTVRPSGAPLLDYPVTERQWRAFRFAQARLAEMQLASGAREVFTMHDPPHYAQSLRDVAAIDRLPFDIGRLTVSSAHQMGGCAMGDDPKTSVVRSSDLRHHRIENLHVIDGSVFPTSLGVNPQESVYGLARLMATRLAQVV